MRILNAMFSTGLGGIEQSFADYCQALADAGHTVWAMTQKNAKINTALSPQVRSVKINNRGQWDLLAKHRIKSLLNAEQPDIVIAHGNRAISLLQVAKKLGIPVVGVAHNYKLKHIGQCDAAFGVSRDLQSQMISQALIPAERCFHIPNMIKVSGDEIKRSDFRQPPRINTMGRFVEKKGFHLFLQALALLKKDGIAFTAMIGGDGEENHRLQALCQQLELNEEVAFCGWVKDKAQFFAETDVFCLPSLHEPFGIVLLEAFANRCPVVSTASEGPSEIGRHGHDCILTTNGSAQDLKDGLQQLIANPALARSLSRNAQQTLLGNYTPTVVANKIEAALTSVLNASA